MMMKHNNSSNSNNNRSNSIGSPTPPNPNSINIKDIDRRKVSSELAEVMHDICAIKKSLYYGKRNLSKEDEAYFLDEILLGMIKINEYVVNYDIIKFH